MMYAKFIRELPKSDWNGVAKLYELSPPLEGHTFVVVSAVRVLGEPETYIFQANEYGEVTSWGELNGSMRGTLDHETALLNAGYRVDEFEQWVTEVRNNEETT